MKPKEFIQNVLINNIGDISEKYHYISFALIAIGIEFLGKCLNEKQEDWNKGSSKGHFNKALRELNSFAKYRPYIREEYNLWDSLRNGFAHSFVPKKTVSLSHGTEEMTHLNEYTRRGINKINLSCEEFYADFKNACIEVINKDIKGAKISRDMLDTPFD